MAFSLRAASIGLIPLAIRDRLSVARLRASLRLNTVVIRRDAGWRGVSGIISGCVSGESEWSGRMKLTLLWRKCFGVFDHNPEERIKIKKEKTKTRKRREPEREEKEKIKK